MNLHPLIFRDHYRRWWWAHLVGFLLFAAIGVAVGHGLDPHWIPLGAGALLGSAVALTAQTNARILLSLPIRASELGATLWWIVVPLSGLVPTFGLTVGWAVSGRFGSAVPMDVGVLLWFLLLTQAVSAFQFTVVGFIPNAETHDLRDKTPGVFTAEFGSSGLIASCFFPLFWSEPRALWDPLSCGILAMGVMCGIVSWRRRTAFLLQRSRKNEGPTQSVRSAVVLPKPSRLDGFAGLYLAMFSMGAAVGLALSGALWAYMASSPDRMAAIRPHVVPAHRFGDTVTIVMRPGVLARAQATLMCMMIAFPFLSVWSSLASLRHWRTLPISAQSMAWVLIGLHLTGWFGSILPMHALMKWLSIQSSWPASQPLLVWSDLGLLVLEAGLFAMVLAFALRFGVKSFTPWWFVLLSPLVGVTHLMLSPILERFFEQGGEPLATVASALTGVILLFVAQAWIVRSLRHQSRIFSPGFHQFGRLNAGS